MASTTPLLRAHHAEQLAAAATALAGVQHGRDLAEALADSATAFAASAGDTGAAARLADAAAAFAKATADIARLLRAHNDQKTTAAAAALAGGGQDGRNLAATGKALADSPGDSDAAALAGGQHGRDLAAAAKALADSARAFADSPEDPDAAARLADAATFVTKLAAYNAALQPATFLPGDDLSVPLSARTLGLVAVLLAEDLRDTALAATAKAFADSARGFAGTPRDLDAAAKLADASRHLAAAAMGTTQDATVSDILRAVHIVLSFYHPRASGCCGIAFCSCFGRGEKKSREEGQEPTLAPLADEARSLAECAAGTTMAEAAIAFSKAFQRLVSAKDKNTDSKSIFRTKQIRQRPVDFCREGSRFRTRTGYYCREVD
ncbi:unnamed protein product [Urochloa decumbens]|uniref:Uncharacterized protein n=1 Tax=Urochloa decumbens TaxID=240449 RepID=A0ABC9A7N4_9POAL